MCFKIKATEPFMNKLLKTFDKSEIIKFSKFKEKLKHNSFLGKQIRIPYIREFKTKKGKRAYFIVYLELKIILFVAVSNKKNQDLTINEIFKNISKFKKFVYQNYKS